MYAIMKDDTHVNDMFYILRATMEREFCCIFSYNKYYVKLKKKQNYGIR